MPQIKKESKPLNINLDRYVFEELDFFRKDQGINRTEAVEMLLDKAIESFYLEHGESQKLDSMRETCEKLTVEGRTD